jgi:transcriptional regulator with XRE-family HTH domain
MVFKRLKELRIKKGISQEELARYLFIARSNIGKYENGDLDLNTEILIKYAQFFSVSIDYILELTDNETQNIKIPNDYIGVLSSEKDISPEKLKKLIAFAKVSGLFDEE